MSDILYDARWIGNHGIGRLARELQRRLPNLVPFRARRAPFHPFDPALLGMALWHTRPKLFFSPGYNPPLRPPCPFVFTLYDLNHLHIPENSSVLKRAYYQYIIKPACHAAAFVLTASEYSRSQIREWSGIREEKIVNVSCGVGPPFSHGGDKYDPGYPYLLYVGGRKPHKNLPRLLQAFAGAGVDRDVRLLLAGTADAETCGLIGRLRLGGAVQFVDAPQDERLAAVYRGALALLFPSLYEGFGLPPLEALACGVPVLTSTVCSLPEVVGDAGILVDPRSIESISAGIRRLVEDTELRNKLRSKGLQRAQKFPWAETARRTRETLELAAAQGRPN